MPYVILAIAILIEVVATTLLKTTENFTKLMPSILVIMGYSASIYLLTLVLKSIPVGIAYAIWAGAGIALVAIVAAITFKQIPDLPAIIGISLIIAGVIVLNLFSKMPVH